jgi:hypothetical protein
MKERAKRCGGSSNALQEPWGGYAPYVAMAWTMWCLYGLNYAFACASCHDISMSHYA